MKLEVRQTLLEHWQQIKCEPVSVGIVGSQRFETTRDDLRGPTLMQAGDELLDINQIAARLGVPKSTVYELTRRRGSVRHSHPLPCFKVGRRLKFNWSRVLDWLTELENEGVQ